MSVLLNQSSLTDLFNPFVCTQGIGNVAKETEDEVKRHGVKGVKALKDDGVDGSFVVNCKLKDVAPKVFSNIGDRLESYQNVAKETEQEVKRHGVKGVKVSKDDSVEGSFVSFRQGIENVAKEIEDEVKRHGVNGVKASKYDGVEERFVSFRQVYQFYSTNHLLLTC